MLTNLPALSQEAVTEEKSKIRIHIIQEENGKSKVQEKIYDIDNLSETEQKAHIDRILDSLGKEKKADRRITITLEEGNVHRNNGIRPPRRVYGGAFPIEAPHWGQAFAYSMDSLTRHFDTVFVARRQQLDTNLRRLMADTEVRVADARRAVAERFHTAPSQPFVLRGFSDESASKTLKSISIFPNQPFDNLLNVRFRTLEKGDVTITVRDTKGREIGKKELKDFEGEFVGQVSLEKSAKGTLFVSVVQQEDGVVKRVVIPEKE